MNSDERQLNRAFEAYREACPAPEPSAGFMPGLWNRIDAGRTVSLPLRRWTKALVAAAMALSIAMAIYTAIPGRNEAFSYYMTYVDTLEEDVVFETLAYSELVSIDTAVALETE